MKLEDQVCSLELSKKLKELGVKQENLFTFYLSKYPEMNTTSLERTSYSLGKIYENNYSAFTVAELGNILSTKENNNTIRCTMAYTDWVCDYESHRTSGATEANARAKMLIYLLENKLITL